MPKTHGHAQAVSPLRQEDRVRLAEAARIAGRVGDKVWPGWDGTPLSILLVSDSAEFLIAHPRPSPDFTPIGYDSLLRSDVRSRPRQFAPTLLATFPAVGGLPTIVIGTAERTGKSSTAWVLTLLHEHFHQWQYSLAGYYPGVSRLDLARGDTTGSWMLNYPFPYDSVPVQRAMHGLATALVRALKAREGRGNEALAEVIAARDTLRRRLGSADYRYFEFQLWQEGVARYIEYAAARAAAKLGAPSKAFQRLPDYESYERVSERALLSLKRELEQLDLARARRVAFYPVGAAIAIVLQRTAPNWRERYTQRPFSLAALLAVSQPRDD